MVGRLFKKEKTLYTVLSEAEIFENLQKYSVGGNLNNPKIKTFFRGRFDRDKHRFTLEQIFDVGMNNQVRPEIHGLVQQSVKALQFILALDYLDTWSS